MSKQLTLTVDLGILGEIDVEVDYDASAGTPDVMYLPNGDPGYPGDPAEFTINSVFHGKLDLTPLFADCEAFSDIAAEKAWEAMTPDEDRADFEYDQRRESQED